LRIFWPFFLIKKLKKVGGKSAKKKYSNERKNVICVTPLLFLYSNALCCYKIDVFENRLGVGQNSVTFYGRNLKKEIEFIITKTPSQKKISIIFFEKKMIYNHEEIMS